MNWIGSGFVTIINYGTFGGGVEEEFSILTENNFNLTTESSSDLLTESAVV